jgi:hypothetical protein
MDIEPAWKEAAEKMKGEYIAPKFWEAGKRYPKIMVLRGRWTVTASVNELAKGHHQTTITAPYPGPNGSEFVLCKGEDCDIPDYFGKDHNIGHAQFDKEYKVKTKRPELVSRLLDDEELLKDLCSYNSLRIALNESGKAFELEISDLSIILDVAALVALVEVAIILLDRLSDLREMTV